MRLSSIFSASSGAVACRLRTFASELKRKCGSICAWSILRRASSNLWTNRARSLSASSARVPFSSATRR
jgi:hypothetical protein